MPNQNMNSRFYRLYIGKTLMRESAQNVVSELMHDLNSRVDAATVLLPEHRTSVISYYRGIIESPVIDIGLTSAESLALAAFRDNAARLK